MKKAATQPTIGSFLSTARLEPPLPVLLAATLIFAVAVWLRLSGVGWDGWANLHPDERHMIFVTQDLQRSLSLALETDKSLSSIWFGPAQVLDPRAEGRWHVYGDLPLLVLVWLSRVMGISDWGSTLWLGRSLTSMVEATSVIAVFVMSRQLAMPARAGLAAMLLLAMAPTSLQLALFFTVDAWLVAFSTWALVAWVAVARQGGAGAVLAAGALSGLAAACKLTAIVMVLPALTALWLVWRGRGGPVALRGLALGLAAGLVAFRLANPSAFAGGGLWDLRPSAAMIADFRELAATMESADIPPNWQWLAGYSLLALARDMLLFGTGPVLAFLGLAGLGRLRGVAWVVVVALAGHLLLNAASELKILRYLAPVVPIVAILATAPLARLRSAAFLLVLAAAGWWGFGTLQLHDGQHPRLVATEWMRRLPLGAALGVESDWDESLPVMQAFPAREWSTPPGPFTTVPLNLTDPDGPETAARLAQALAQVNYVVISSGRQIEVMPRLPQRFPTVSRYYRALLAGELCFVRVLHIDRGYPLPFWRLDDSFAQEAWRVYDHPIVQIWQKQPCFDPAEAKRILSGG